MAKSSESDSGGFDLDRFRKLLQLMDKYGVTETQLTKGEESWKVRRGPKQVVEAPMYSAPPVYSTPPLSSPDPVAAGTPTAAGQETSSAAATGKTIDAPTVGTFYAAANPEDEPFISVGSTVKADTIVCIIEAMKVFNQIPAETSGKVVEVLVDNGEPVEFGQPLFRIE
ncbi:MAG: acetyl-CoA carboxylase biotin carboxyl carrier protein [Fuerstiella sp.]|nr:acetyl-CoA carboxylase biotin carboxyl carrier protein [Fuerstiella sp.]